MIQIEILGPGCSKCQVLYQRADEAAKALGVEYEIKKVTDIETIIGYGVMSTPALVVNGMVRLAGRVPTAEQLRGYLS
ncbi:MAG TPA: thioredoxin family protein [Candidatus Eisenbacteria bacterium]|nr:thioredoxin family protein [Candidatus Eisenbacteria bacterium]